MPRVYTKSCPCAKLMNLKMKFVSCLPFLLSLSLSLRHAAPLVCPDSSSEMNSKSFRTRKFNLQNRFVFRSLSVSFLSLLTMGNKIRKMIHHQRSRTAFIRNQVAQPPIPPNLRPHQIAIKAILIAPLKPMI